MKRKGIVDVDKTQTLWTRNFKLATTGMIISALAGVGLNIALSVVVFDETQSTLLNSIYLAASFLPSFILPFVLGPYVDRHDPLKILVRNEIVLAIIFILAGTTLYFVEFSFVPFLIVSMIISSLGVLSNLASQSVLPQLMDKKFYSQGNAIISTIYPLSNVIVAPIIMILLTKVGLPFILIWYGVACLFDAFIESKIDEEFEYIESSEAVTLKTYQMDLKEGFNYLKNDKSLLTVLIFFSFVLFANGSTTLTYPFFNTSSVLTDENYGLLLSFQSAGYMFGGFFHYLVKIPDKWRYSIAVIVYFVFSFLDGFFFFMPYVMMLIVRFILGFGGMNSANIRVSAVQQRVHNTMRAKINALFSIAFTLSEVMGQLGAGALGEVLPYRYIQLGFNVIYFLAIVIFILPPKNQVKELYNYST